MHERRYVMAAGRATGVGNRLSPRIRMREVLGIFWEVWEEDAGRTHGC
jgi:hypothetical protein